MISGFSYCRYWHQVILHCRYLTDNELKKGIKRLSMNKIPCNRRAVTQSIFSLIAWGMVVYASVMFAQPWLTMGTYSNLHADKILAFRTEQPSNYRVIVPVLANIVFFLGIPSRVAVFIVICLSGILCYGIIRLLTESYYHDSDSNYVVMVSIIAYFAVYLMIQIGKNHFDFMSVFLFLLSIRLLLQDKKRAYMLLLPVVALHRWESVILLAMYFCIYYFRRSDQKVLVLFMLYHILVTLVIRTMVTTIVPETYGTNNHFLAHDVMGTYLRTPIMAVTIPMAIFLVWVMVKKRDYMDASLLVLFSLFFWQIVFHLLFGNPFEFRVLAETIPAVVLVVSFPDQHVKIPKAATG